MMSRRWSQQNGARTGARWTTLSCRFSVQGRTGFPYSRQDLRLQSQSLHGLARDSIVNHLSFLSCLPLSALAPGLGLCSCWTHCAISSSLISWLLLLLLWRQRPSVLSHCSKLRTAPGGPPQTPRVVSAVVRQALWE